MADDDVINWDSTSGYWSPEGGWPLVRIGDKMAFEVFLAAVEKYGHPEDARAIGALLDERDRYRTALEMLVADSQRPELANVEHLRGIAIGALRA